MENKQFLSSVIKINPTELIIQTSIECIVMRSEPLSSFHAANNLKVQQTNKGVSFWRNCDAAPVGEYSR